MAGSVTRATQRRHLLAAPAALSHANAWAALRTLRFIAISKSCSKNPPALAPGVLLRWRPGDASALRVAPRAGTSGLTETFIAARVYSA